jgi:hypothetical protein
MLIQRNLLSMTWPPWSAFAERQRTSAIADRADTTG